MECLVPTYIVQVVVRDHYVGTSGNLLLIVLAATMAIEVIGSEECRLQGDRVGYFEQAVPAKASQGAPWW